MPAWRRPQPYGPSTARRRISFQKWLFSRNMPGNLRLGQRHAGTQASAARKAASLPSAHGLAPPWHRQHRGNCPAHRGLGVTGAARGPRPEPQCQRCPASAPRCGRRPGLMGAQSARRVRRRTAGAALPLPSIPLRLNQASGDRVGAVMVGEHGHEAGDRQPDQGEMQEPTALSGECPPAWPPRTSRAAGTPAGSRTARTAGWSARSAAA